MVHSIELLFDEPTDAQLRRCWRQLADAGLPSQSRVQSATNRPHVTLLAAEHIDTAADAAVAQLLDRLPLDGVVGAPLLFGRRSYVLARLIVASPDLLALHADVHDVCAPHLRPGPAPHSAPGHWTPHVTLGRRFSAEEAGRALTAVPELGRDLTGRLVALRHWDGDQRVEHLLGGV
ncbi:2'-5' RNA ligase family protein [[Mycobacterium] burgundiense]|uniref:2'-5' RNA ligase family protein n=1 Tax=[Mycobacterium] burgundiense TaxID=3064286 RepID=A0ABN9NCT6_9MYCO|nr:2'-5' RNA ligase family protein [Mycolicibacterium sp. MU0053]CAJ1504232.1 2'-5' RNA ligase family protein [Mycolicibacterium sp. MU0053]